MGWGLDFGVLHSLKHNLHAGIAILHLGSMSRLNKTRTPLPRELQVGLSYQINQRSETVIELHKIRDSQITAHFGNAIKINEKIILRAGYQTHKNRTWSTGISIKVNRWYVDYAYIPLREDLGQAHRVNLRLLTGTMKQ